MPAAGQFQGSKRAMMVSARIGGRWRPVVAWRYGAFLTLWVLGRWIASQGHIDDPGGWRLMPVKVSTALVARDRLDRLTLTAGHAGTRARARAPEVTSRASPPRRTCA